VIVAIAVGGPIVWVLWGQSKRDRFAPTLCPTVFDRNILSLDIAGFFQPLVKCGDLSG
jgi:hypothetical protein